MTPPTWLITGASSGLGKSIALECLKAGFKVIGTTRDVKKAEPQVPDFASNGGIWYALDPASKNSYDQFVKLSKEYNVDVLVNNAGYAFIGGVEDTSEEEIRDQMEVNYFGPLRAVRAVLPVLRKKRSGDIVLISSGAGFQAKPGRSTYSASKFAIEAAHEALAGEVATLGIKVLIVEPGAFRTPFAAGIKTPAAHEATGGLSEAYKGTALEQMVMGSRAVGLGQVAVEQFAKGDPDRAAKVIINAVTRGHDYLRLPLGTDCVVALEAKIKLLQGDLDETWAIATSTDTDQMSRLGYCTPIVGRPNW